MAACLASAWGQTAPGKPVKNRLYARDAQDKCQVPYEATGSGANDSLILEIHGNNELKARLAKPDADGKVAFSATLAAGLVDYRFTLLSKKGAVTSQVEKLEGVLCGDAYVLYGQSNAEAIPGWSSYFGPDGKKFTSPWVRSFQGSWMVPNARQTGVWGLHISRLIVEKHKVPVAIVNAAKGNTTVEHLSPEYVIPASETEWIGDTQKYGNFYKRMTGWVKEAGLTGGIRAILWHQGERNVYGSDFTEFLKYDYGQAFLKLRVHFQKDFPGLKKVFTFQIKTGCGVDSYLWSHMFETQRKLAEDLGDVEIMSTLAYDVVGCHYSDDKGLVGYTLIGDMLFRQLDSVFYGGRYPVPVSPPNLIQAAYTSPQKNEVVLLFDQDVQWNDSLVYNPANPVHIQHFPGRPNPASPTYLKSLFAFDSLVLNQVLSGSSQGRKVFLKLKSGHAVFKKIAYPHGNLPGGWPGPFLTGPGNGLGALGFLVPIDNALSPVGVVRESREPEHGRPKLSRSPGGRMVLEMPPGFSRSEADRVVEIRNPAGTVVRRQPGRPGASGGGIALDLDGLPEGLYICILRDGKRAIGVPFTLIASMAGR